MKLFPIYTTIVSFILDINTCRMSETELCNSVIQRVFSMSHVIFNSLNNNKNVIGVTDHVGYMFTIIKEQEIHKSFI